MGLKATPSDNTAPHNRTMFLSLLANAAEHGYRKAGGTVYKPVPGCPCAYSSHATYKDYINKVLAKDPVFRSDPCHYDDMLKFLQNYTLLVELPELSPDRGLMSFSNGVLHLSDGSFTPYAVVGADHPLASAVARHHIHKEYTGSSDTPLLDLVLDAQFADRPGVAELLLAMLGRLLFTIGEVDRWAVMPHLVGGTGKSLILAVADSLFRKGAIGNLGSKREEISNLVDKEAIFGRNIVWALPLKPMISGEPIDIARESLTDISIDWTAPVIMASKHKYSGEGMRRRMVPFRFDRQVRPPREGLLESIRETELPNIVCRVLGAYRSAVERAEAAGGFWKSVPAAVLEERSGRRGGRRSQVRTA